MHPMADDMPPYLTNQDHGDETGPTPLLPNQPVRDAYSLMRAERDAARAEAARLRAGLVALRLEEGRFSHDGGFWARFAAAQNAQIAALLGGTDGT